MISIIGSGPAGAYLAYLLAKEGFEINVFEEHKEIGKPVQCAGIITSSVNDIISIPKDIVLNKINILRVYYKNKFVDFPVKANLVIDRAKFDQYLFSLAKKEGANFMLGHKYLNFNKNKVKTNKGIFNTDILVGADGPFSPVAKTNGLYFKRKFVHGIQARVKGRFNPNIVEIHLDKGQFGWIIPESNSIVRAGVIGNKELVLQFKKLIGKKKIIEYQSGAIPIYDYRQKLRNKNVYLIGDAAGMVKATTYGGVIYGLMAAQELAQAIKLNKNYFRLCRKRFSKELWLSLMIRKVLNRFDEKDYQDLINILSDKKVKELLEKYDRDYPVKLLLKIVLIKPRILRFIFKVL